MGHKEKWIGQQSGLRRALQEYQNRCGDDDPTGKTASRGARWLSEDYPSPLDENPGTRERSIRPGLIIVGGVIIILTLVEDALTSGAGIGDDPVTVGAGMGLIGKGLGVMP